MEAKGNKSAQTSRRILEERRVPDSGDFRHEQQKTKENKQVSVTVRTLARVLRTSDPKLRTKIKYNNNFGKTEGVGQRDLCNEHQNRGDKSFICEDKRCR